MHRSSAERGPGRVAGWAAAWCPCNRSPRPKRPKWSRYPDSTCTA
ncbi:hypothetical protein [Lysobacter gummosus]